MGPGFVRASRAAAMVLEMGVLALLGGLGGAWLDGKLGTPPLFLLVFGLLALLAGLARILRTLNRLDQPHDGDAP